jgi:hypothetical protein
MAAMNLYASRDKDNVMVYKFDKQRGKNNFFIALLKLQLTLFGTFDVTPFFTLQKYK